MPERHILSIFFFHTHNSYIFRNCFRVTEFESHIEKACPAKECKPLFTYKVIPEKCVNCGDCLEACKDNAIVGEKRVSYRSGYLPFEIADERCTRCDECIKVCKYDAIEIVDEKELSEVTA